MPIQVLSKEVAAHIAAGEVVERPSSAVKELVENSIDAGATHVQVEVISGGLEGIRVVDNGHGIPIAEVVTLFQRHATSKLISAADLDSITTMGFRGEALYSLAAVAEVSLLTRTADQESAVFVEARNGSVSRQEPRGGPIGTTVSVNNLFAQVPARKKFLKTPKSELARIHTVMTHYSLAHPDVRFSLLTDGRTSFSSPGNGDLREAIAAVYNRGVAQALLAVESLSEAGIKVSGLVSAPDLYRANRSYISLYVNQRPIQSRTLTYAVTEAYRGMMANERFPLATLMISIPAADVDVNVHPTKSEVRFRAEGDVFSALQRGVREVIVGGSPIPEMGVAGFADGQGTLMGTVRVPEGNRGSRSGFSSGLTPDTKMRPRVDVHEPISQEVFPMMEALPALRVLGQSQETYIVAEGPDGLYLIDQHAAHECVVYERLKIAAAKQNPEVQGLLEPAMVELTWMQAETVHEHGDVLTQYGWVLEPFGDQTYLLRGVPAVLATKGPAKAFIELLDGAGEAGEFRVWEERIAATVACHGSVRAGLVLSHEEMVEMVRLLEKTQQPHTCPHGRPTMLHLSVNNLERQFGRKR